MKVYGKELKSAFKLFQPWAYEIVTGKLPYLIRSINTRKRGRVGVIATDSIDSTWILNADRNWIDKTRQHLKTGLIGSVCIENVIQTTEKNLGKILSRFITEKYFSDYYPIHLIPKDKPSLFIWTLTKPEHFTEAVAIKSQRTMVWMRI